VPASLLPTDELGERELDAWRELSQSALVPNPYFDPDFALPMARALGSRVALLVATDGPQWIGCLPVESTRRWRRVPLRGLVTWRHLYCFLGTPLLRSAAAERAMTEMIGEARRGRDAFLGLDLLDVEGDAAASMEAAHETLDFRTVEMDTFERASVSRRAEPDYLALSPKHRRNFERLRRRMEGELEGELELRDRTSDPGAIGQFLEIEASGWKGEHGTATAMGPIGHGDLLRDVCERMDRRGMLELVSADCGETTVAMLCNLIAGDTSFTFKIAIEDELNRFSPGVQLEILYLERFHADARLNRIDSCADQNNQMINRLWPDRRQLGIRAIPMAGMQGVSARPVLEGLAWLRRRRN
jgi:CelD/BcsL family acetyltransferase involved in cellulose biosynthesis